MWDYLKLNKIIRKFAHLWTLISSPQPLEELQMLSFTKENTLLHLGVKIWTLSVYCNITYYVIDIQGFTYIITIVVKVKIIVKL